MAEEKNKRTGNDRREKTERRIKADPNYTVPEKRKGGDRRSGLDRRDNKL